MGELDHNIFVFEEPFTEITSNHYEHHKILSFIDKLKVGEKVKLHTCINIKESIEDSPFFDKYLVDEKLNVKQSFAIFALIDGALQPLYYTNTVEETAKIYEVELGKSILISPELKLTKKGIQSLTLLVLCYPYSDPEQLLGSYKITNWSTNIISNEIAINVTE